MSNADKPINGELKQCGDQAIKQGGITLREHYVGLSLQGLLANPSLTLTTHRQYALEAYRAADEALTVLDDNRQGI